MKNRNNLPDWLVTVVEKTRNDYDPGHGDISATSLLLPPLIYALQKEVDYEEDASDNLAALDGTALHAIIEKQLEGEDRYIIEERFYRDIFIPDAPGEKKTFKISGQIDVFDKTTATLWDAKRSKIFKWKKGDFFDYEAQLNCGKWLLEANGIEVKELKIAFFPKDHDRNEHKRNKDYPVAAFIPIDIPLWHNDDVESFIRRSVIEKMSALKGHRRICTPEERWARPSKWAVMKKGRKSAVRVFDTEQEAVLLLNTKDKNHYIEHRPGEDIRCTGFCPVNFACSYYREVYGED